MKHKRFAAIATVLCLLCACAQENTALSPPVDSPVPPEQTQPTSETPAPSEPVSPEEPAPSEEPSPEPPEEPSPEPSEPPGQTERHVIGVDSGQPNPDTPHPRAPYEVLAEALPEEYRERALQHTWDPVTRSILTNGTAIIVPNMPFLDLDQSILDTLVCVERDIPAFPLFPEYDERGAVYESEDLRIRTLYYPLELADGYEEVGVEYIRTVTVLTDAFWTYQGIRLGDSAEHCGLFDDDYYRTGATPYMTYTCEGGVLTHLKASSYSDPTALYLSDSIWLLWDDLP